MAITATEAAALAEKLPASIGDLVSKQIDEDLEPYRERSDAARASTIQADATIREYLPK